MNNLLLEREMFHLFTLHSSLGFVTYINTQLIFTFFQD